MANSMYFSLCELFALDPSVYAYGRSRKSDKKRVRENSRICAEKFPQKVRPRLRIFAGHGLIF